MSLPMVGGGMSWALRSLPARTILWSCDTLSSWEWLGWTRDPFAISLQHLPWALAITQLWDMQGTEAFSTDLTQLVSSLLYRGDPHFGAFLIQCRAGTCPRALLSPRRGSAPNRHVQASPSCHGCAALAMHCPFPKGSWVSRVPALQEG